MTTELDQFQQAAATSTAPRILCVAGPGSGKTKTLLARAMLFHPPQSVCVVTFTNAAADELRKRWALLDGRPLGFVGTLHSLMLRLLMEAGNSVTLVDNEQQEGLLAGIAASIGCKTSVKKLVAMLNPWKYAGLRGAGLLVENTKNKDELVLVQYYRSIRAASLYDFDTLLFYGHREVQRLGAAFPFQHLLVDEFQDSGDADVEIYNAMPCATRFMVGDPDQAIYGFRGGNVNHMLGLFNDHRWEIHCLETNYRSATQICDQAQTVINHNAMRIAKATKPARPDCGGVGIQTFNLPAEESSAVAAAVTQLNEYTETAVLCRTNALAESMTNALRAAGLPVVERKHVQKPEGWREAKLLLSVLANPWCDMAVEQLLAQTKGAEAAQLAAAAAMRAGLGLNESLGFPFGHGQPDLQADMLRLNVPVACREMILEAVDACVARGAFSLQDVLIELNDGRLAETGTGVTVTTMHAAKGREWKNVFLVGCEDGVIPSARAIKAGNEAIEEERRICFVAATRAKERLFISYCTHRPESRGRNMPPGPLLKTIPSRFVKEMGLTT